MPAKASQGHLKRERYEEARVCSRSKSCETVYMPCPLSADDILDDLSHLGHLAVYALCQGNEVFRAVEVLGLVSSLFNR